MTAAMGSAREGDGHEAFERLALPFLGDVARFARSLTRDPTRADDLVQETYLQALRGWHTFHEGADPRRWLFTVCRHTFLRAERRETRYVEAPDDDPELESLATAVAHAAAERSGAADAVERLDLGTAISGALAALPPHYRLAVVLVDVEGQPYEEAAAVLGVAVGTVRSRLFRGRRLLQDVLYVHARDAGFAGGRTPAPAVPAPDPSQPPPRPSAATPSAHRP
jgi:RNA polymerase sigma-70 factor (ECF subfamily)